MLLETCINRLFEPPLKIIQSKYPPSEAPKINPEYHAKIDWGRQTAEEVERYCGALTTLWCRFGPRDYPDRRKRAILTQLTYRNDKDVNIDEPAQPGDWKYYLTGPKFGVLLIKCRSGWIEVGGIKIEGKTLTDGGEWARSMAAHNKGPNTFT